MNLIDAVKANNLERVSLLVEQGVDIEMGDCEGKTPLYWASKFGLAEMARYLMEQRAMVGKTIRGVSYLMLAMRRGHFGVVRCLLEQGADSDKADKDGMTPLHRAIFGRQLGVVRCMLEQGADRDKATNDGMTPLHYAAYYGHLELAMLLMSYGADLNARDNRGRLPIDMPGATDEIKQAIRDEPRRRMDEAPGKRATEEDRHPNAATATSASTHQKGEEAIEEVKKKLRLDGEGIEEETKVAEEDEDSEPSSDGEDA